MNLEDELFDLLNSPDPILTSKSVGGGDGTAASNFVITTASYEDSSDFLSWLDDSPAKKPPEIKLEHSTSLLSRDDHAGFTPVSQSVPSQISSPSNPTIVAERNESMDQFLSDIFGSDSPKKDIGVKPAPIAADSAVLESIHAIISSPFPDIGKLREVIHNTGFIPSSVRVQVLSLLLTGSCHVDEEAQRFHVEINSDIFTDINRQIPNTNTNPHLSHDILDIITLYCQRRSVSYQPHYTQILLLLYGTGYDTPKSQISSCFYSLLTTFLPLINLQYTAHDLAVDYLHTILRFLLLYHSPRLTQHLDRVLPSWEKPYQSTKEHDNLKFKKASSALDSLEKELGIDLGFDFDDEHQHQNESATPVEKKETEQGDVIESAPPTQSGGGIIPTPWIMSLFGGGGHAMTDTQKCFLLDWSIFNHHKFTGLYLIVTLFLIHEDILLTMTGNMITTWIHSIFTNETDLFTMLQTTVKTQEKHSFKSYSLAWLYTMTTILKNTPESVQKAINETENWAIIQEKYQLQQTLLLQQTETEENEEDIFGEKMEENTANFDETATKNDTKNDDKMSEISDTTTTDTTFTRRASSLLQKITTQLTLKTWKNGQLTTHDFDDPETEKYSPSIRQQYPFHCQSKSMLLSLWTESNEVISSLCASHTRYNNNNNSSQTETDQSIKSMFNMILHTQNTSFTAQKLVFYHPPTTAKSETAGTAYFAIDCRSPPQKRLGLFPKAFLLDPELITDGDGLDHLMLVLEPLVETNTHITIIGAGADYHRWHYYHHNRTARGSTANVGNGIVGSNASYFASASALVNMHQTTATTTTTTTATTTTATTAGSNHSTNDCAELRRIVIEDQTRINAIAVYLQTKNFKYVSVVHGGYHALVTALTKHDSKYSLSSALVDVEDRVKLHNMLGLPPPSTASSTTATATAASGGAGGSMVSMVSRLGLENVVHDAPIAIKNVGSMISSFVQQHQQPSTAASTSVTNNSQSQQQGAQGQGQGGQQLFAGWGKAFGSSLETIKKNWSATTTTAGQPAAAAASAANMTATAAMSTNSSSFVIDNDDDDDGLGPRDPSLLADSTGVSITRTDLERAQALAMHRMAGLKKGDSITISRSELPGAILFPCTKIKLVPVPAAAGSNTATAAVDAVVAEVKAAADELGSKQDAGSDAEEQPAVVATAAVPAMKEIAVSRYLVVSRERFMVLDAKGGGVGSVATVKSNHHLTELIKMTFKKKDPELVSIFLVGSDGENKTRQYRVSKYREFVTTLQKNMERFKV